MKKLAGLLILVLALLAMVTAAGCGSRDVVASVNGVNISAKDLDQKVEKVKAMYEQQGMNFTGDQGAKMLETLRKSTLQQMINNQLMLQEAKKMGPLTDEQSQELLASFKEEFNSEAEYQSYIGQIDFTEKDIALILNMQNQLVKDLKPATEDEMRAYYEDSKDQMGTPEQLQVRHILFFVDEGDKGYPVKHTDAEAKQIAEDIITQLQQGKNFADLAKEKSEDSGTKTNGGLFVFSKGQAVPEFETAAYALTDGEYTKTPVKTDYGYHIIIREKLIPEQIPPFEEVKSQIANQMDWELKQATFNQFMQDAKNKADITNKLAGPAENQK